MGSKLFVANWKMAKTFSQTIDFCTTYKNDLIDLSGSTNGQLVLCPSFPALASIAEILKSTTIAIGAQTCSPHKEGAYTGQVSALSLKQVGCRFCIIGHSEQRALGISNEQVVAQAMQLIECGIEPIICIGENSSINEQGSTIEFLKEQLKSLTSILTTDQSITIAYEPLWAIGTGKIPTIPVLNEIFSWLSNQTHHRLIYGGSVSAENAHELSSIEHLDGFLIGSASLDFQNFEKIVSLAS